VGVKIITLGRLALYRMAVHAARALDHFGGLDEQSHRTRTFVADPREGRNRLERLLLSSRRYIRAYSQNGDGQAAFG
jgi:hypothetical protein